MKKNLPIVALYALSALLILSVFAVGYVAGQHTADEPLYKIRSSVDMPRGQVGGLEGVLGGQIGG